MKQFPVTHPNGEPGFLDSSSLVTLLAVAGLGGTGDSFTEKEVADVFPAVATVLYLTGIIPQEDMDEMGLELS